MGRKIHVPAPPPPFLRGAPRVRGRTGRRSPSWPARRLASRSRTPSRRPGCPHSRRPGAAEGGRHSERGCARVCTGHGNHDAQNFNLPYIHCLRCRGPTPTQPPPPHGRPFPPPEPRANRPTGFLRVGVGKQRNKLNPHDFFVMMMFLDQSVHTVSQGTNFVRASNLKLK